MGLYVALAWLARWLQERKFSRWRFYCLQTNTLKTWLTLSLLPDNWKISRFNYWSFKVDPHCFTFQTADRRSDVSWVDSSYLERRQRKKDDKKLWSNIRKLTPLWLRHRWPSNVTPVHSLSASRASLWVQHRKQETIASLLHIISRLLHACVAQS